jgi:exonuclease III
MKMKLAVAALTSALVVPLVGSSPAPALQAKERTPDNSLMVVTANLAEAWDYADTQKHGDMDTFVARVLDEFKYRPDVLALQEVRKSSADYVARKLSARSGQPYKVVVSPPANPYFPYGGGRAGAKETSIVINAKTMKVLDPGGYLATVAKPEHEVEPNDPVFHQAFALLQKRGTTKKFATMSVHLLPRGYLANMDLDKYYRNKWAKQMHNKLRARYGAKSDLRYLMGGDFNQLGCLRGTSEDCVSKSPFWQTLTGFGYLDTIKAFTTVDYIWSKGMPGALYGLDSGYHSMSKANRYSDHPFRWSVLGPDTYPPLPPKPLTVDVAPKKNGDPRVYLTWGKGDDRAGTGVKKIYLERKLGKDPWTLVDPTFRDYAHYDYEPGKFGDKVAYRVRVKDGAGNFSPWVTRYVELKK